jgi:hypothetical protein
VPDTPPQPRGSRSVSQCTWSMARRGGIIRE